MKKALRFEMKQNLRRPTRIYVKSADLKTSYGYFHADNPSSFDGWNLLSQEQIIELTLFIQNIDAINNLLGEEASNRLIDFRFRLPFNFVSTVHELITLFGQQNIPCNLFEGALTGIIQQLKISTAQINNDKKQEALALLDKIGLATYKKLDLSAPIKTIFSELLAIHNKSEKLHEKALALFGKNKSYSPKAIEGMANGETQPAKWLVACAIDLLLEERLQGVKTCLNDSELFLLWARPLLDHNINPETLIETIHKLKWNNIEHLVNSYLLKSSH